MFIDANELADNTKINADICIFGAGVAGLSIAREFINTPYKVCVLEGGGLGYEPESQALYEGKNVGVDYWSLESARIRFFGGTGNHWGGYCLPLEEDDFEKRSWVNNSGWPFKKADLDPFYDRARTVLKLDNPSFSASSWNADGIPTLPFDSNAVENRVMQMSPYSEVQIPFGAAYKKQFKEAKNIDVYLHANLLNINTNEHASSVSNVEVLTFSGKKISVSAKSYTLALGGIENARQLLLSNNVQKNGLGNQHDLVGRYFADHPFLSSRNTMLITQKGVKTKLFSRKLIKSNKISAYLTLSPKIRKNKDLLTTRFTFEPISWSNRPKGPSAISTIWKSAKHLEIPEHFPGKIKQIVTNADNVLMSSLSAARGHKLLHARYISTEVIPNHSSRVLLGDEIDRFGQRQVILDWRIDGQQEIESINRSLKILGIEMGKADLGRFHVPEKQEAWPEKFAVGMHHMGTTRMHSNPKEGVVDANSKIHGVSNLFIAGSSVFPTYGHANPTFTIVALALRLADHLKKTIR